MRVGSGEWGVEQRMPYREVGTRGTRGVLTQNSKLKTQNSKLKTLFPLTTGQMMDKYSTNVL